MVKNWRLVHNQSGLFAAGFSSSQNYHKRIDYVYFSVLIEPADKKSRRSGGAEAPPFIKIIGDYLHTTSLFVVTEPVGSMDRIM